MIHLILLSGGSGTRLWPLSNNSRSKQFLKVLRDDQGNSISMVQRVLSQIEAVKADLDVTITACSSQEYSIKSQIHGCYKFVFEPERRDTAPAIMLSCAHLELEQHASLDDTVVVMPIDTFAEQEFYNKIIALDNAVQSNMADIVLLGVKPLYPSEKYGYIVPLVSEGSVYKVSHFIEKPNEDYASELIKQSAMWNCGVFAFKLGFLSALRQSYVDTADYYNLLMRYSELPKNSFDYEVVEKADSIAVVPYGGTWKDLGTWNTLTDEMLEPIHGRVVASDLSGVHVINETGLPMIVSGLQDSVVVATHDGILVSSKEKSPFIKTYVQQVAETRPMYEKRRWGEYRVIDSKKYSNGEQALTKELIINEKMQLSYQRHAFRNEIWTVVCGEGEVVVDGEVMPVAAGSVIDVKAGQFHAAHACTELHIIEVQLGSSLVEEDIERFGYYWGS